MGNLVEIVIGRSKGINIQSRRIFGIKRSIQRIQKPTKKNNSDVYQIKKKHSNKNLRILHCKIKVHRCVKMISVEAFFCQIMKTKERCFLSKVCGCGQNMFAKKIK
jgi:hypothetical protein